MNNSMTKIIGLNFFGYIPKQSPDGSARISPNSYASECFEPSLVELHQTVTFERRSTVWATAHWI